jgi:hypothetical protein
MKITGIKKKNIIMAKTVFIFTVMYTIANTTTITTLGDHNFLTFECPHPPPQKKKQNIGVLESALEP